MTSSFMNNPQGHIQVCTTEMKASQHFLSSTINSEIPLNHGPYDTGNVKLISIRPLLLNEYYSSCDLSAVCSSFEHTPTEQTKNSQSKTNAWLLNKRSTPVKPIMVKSQSFSFYSKASCRPHVRTINFENVGTLAEEEQETPNTSIP